MTASALEGIKILLYALAVIGPLRLFAMAHADHPFAQAFLLVLG